MSEDVVIEFHGVWDGCVVILLWLRECRRRCGHCGFKLKGFGVRSEEADDECERVFPVFDGSERCGCGVLSWLCEEECVDVFAVAFFESQILCVDGDVRVSVDLDE